MCQSCLTVISTNYLVVGQEEKFCHFMYHDLCLEQFEVRFARGYYPSPAQSADSIGKSTSLDAEVVGKSLPVKRDGELMRTVFL